MLKAITATTAALALLSLAGVPAYAATTVVDDGADATGSPHDILRVKVDHRQERLVVRTSYTDLRKVSDGGPSSTAIFIDARRSRKGPELALVSGLESGTDYALVRVRDWKLSDRRVDCDHRFTVRWKKDVTKLALDRDCFGERGKVRVSQKMVDEWDGSHPVVDWAPGRRAFSPWVRTG